MVPVLATDTSGNGRDEISVYLPRKSPLLCSDHPIRDLPKNKISLYAYGEEHLRDITEFVFVNSRIKHIKNISCFEIVKPV